MNENQNAMYLEDLAHDIECGVSLLYASLEFVEQRVQSGDKYTGCLYGVATFFEKIQEDLEKKVAEHWAEQTATE